VYVFGHLSYVIKELNKPAFLSLAIRCFPLIFVIAGVSAVVIAWLTVGYQSLKVARTNPVDSLRHE